MAVIDVGSAALIGNVETVMLTGGAEVALVGIGAFVAGYVVRDLIDAVIEKLQ
jgi:hypothetical protein